MEITTSSEPGTVFSSLKERLGKDTAHDLTILVENGFPIEFIRQLREEGFTPGEIHALVIPARTLKHRKAKRQSLSPEEADRAVRLARIYDQALRVFGNPEKALHWLRRRNPRLDGRTPLDMLKTEVGGDLVEQMLYQIDEGIYV
jgi:putative toxin-antitoxin system antitoxin component (TIGR02293 family)